MVWYVTLGVSPLTFAHSGPFRSARNEDSADSKELMSTEAGRLNCSAYSASIAHDDDDAFALVLVVTLAE